MKTPRSLPKFNHSTDYHFSEDKEILRQKINEEIKNLKKNKDDSPNSSDEYPCDWQIEAQKDIDEVLSKEHESEKEKARH